MLEAVFGIKSSDESLISSQTLPQSGLLSDERQVSLPELLDMESRGDYSRLAALIGAHQETALFRKFASLNAQNILYLQAELVHLESELGNITQENKYSGDSEKASFLASLFNLKESSGTTKDLQWRKFLEVREKLKEYNSALLQYSQIQKFEKPRDGDLRLLQEWLNRPEGGDFFLQGREADIWEAPEDIIALSSRQAEKDSLTRWISESLVPWYHRRWGHRVKKSTTSSEGWAGLWHYDDSIFVSLVTAFSTALSSLLPSASILILYLVQNPLARLAIIMAFTALFSVTLTTVSNARRIDVFAATSAFAAVQVVFIGNTGFYPA